MKTAAAGVEPGAAASSNAGTEDQDVAIAWPLVQAHAALLHERAHGIVGKLVVAGFGENPQTGKALKPQVYAFEVGDVRGTMTRIEMMTLTPHLNIYMPPAVMRPNLPPHHKGKESDVIAVLAAVADFDSYTEEEGPDGKPRRFHQDVSRWSADVPVQPSFVLRTSTLPLPSYQAFFLYDHPLTDLAEAKARAVGLAQHTKCDPTVKDVSHVFRIPGTPNWPKADKVAAGRPMEPQQVCFEVPYASVLINPMLMPLPRAGVSARTVASASEANAVPIPERFEQDLRSDQPLRLRWEGDATKLRDTSGSGRDMSLASMLFRRGYSRAEIAAIVMAFSHGKKKKDAAYVERTLDKLENPDLAEMNEKHAVINDGGKTRVINFDYDEDLSRQTLTRSEFLDITKRYIRPIFVGMNKKTGEPKYRGLGDWWLDHPQRLQYDKVIFAPGREVPDALNLWRGFAVQPKPGDWSKFADHTRDVICAGNESAFNYVLNWMALTVQQPGLVMEVAIVLRGGQGTGKGVWARGFGSLVGDHFVQVTQSRHLVGNFNAHLEDCLVLFVDEALWAGDKQGAGVLKALVTEEKQAIERKGVDVKMTTNHLHIIMATNARWAVPAERDDRRFLVLDVSDRFQGQPSYFAEIQQQLDNGGRAAMLHDLMQRDISGWNRRKVPQTQALADQKLETEDATTKWWHDRLMAGHILDSDDDWETQVDGDALHKAYAAAALMTGTVHRASQTQLGTELKLLLPEGYPTKRRPEEWDELTKRYRKRSVWVFPPLEECRAAFQAYMRVDKIDWPGEEPPTEGPDILAKPTHW